MHSALIALLPNISRLRGRFFTHTVGAFGPVKNSLPFRVVISETRASQFMWIGGVRFQFA